MINGVSLRVDQENYVASVAQSVAYAAVVDKRLSVLMGRRSTAKKHNIGRGWQYGIGRENKGPVPGGVIVADSPSRKRNCALAGVEQFDKLVLVTISLAVAVGISAKAGRGIGKHLAYVYFTRLRGEGQQAEGLEREQRPANVE